MSDEKECCPKFDPKPWDEVTQTWKDKPFITTTVPQIFHMPLPWVYSKAISGMWKKAEKYGIAPQTKDFMLLAYDPSPWKSHLYMTVTKEIKQSDVVTISGTFVSKVFDGPYQNIPKYIGELNNYLNKIGKTAKKLYFYYTTCPKCAKKYGHNYIVVLAEI